MHTDIYGQIVLNHDDVIDQLMIDREWSPKKCLIDFDFCPNTLEINSFPTLDKHTVLNISIEEFDKKCQSSWKMPSEYKKLDIAEWVLNQCKTDAERQRVGEELLMYLDRDAFPLLQYLKYLVDTMRKHKIVWGVGRGSSVASYVLYLIGVHHIDSLYFDLDINEFLKGDYNE
jgi:DNA polymerase III alpha subunit